ncbi:MAG: ribosome maturation factor RimM [Deltaproteobacteria bacterium]|nr:ribosome maturation factor RimM [Deltaproteobacteria bacterium]
MIRLGRVRRPHGIQGELRVEFYGEEPMRLPSVNRLCLEAPDGDGLVPASVIAVKPSPPGILVKLKGVDSRTKAESLQNFYISVPRSSLPPPEEDELYQADLLGLPVVSVDGRSLGTVESFADYGGPPVMTVSSPSGGSFAIPWADGFIREGGPEEGRVVVEDVPGLLDQD